MDLRRIDLNLLVSFEAIVSEASVSRAARRLQAVGQTVGQQAEPRHGHGHADQPHQRTSPRRSERTSFMSSQVSRFLSGLRRR